MPRERLELSRPKGTGPQPAAYANSATGAMVTIIAYKIGVSMATRIDV